MVPWLDGTRPAGPADAEVVARAFGAFDRRLAALPADALVEVIHHFHDPPHRLARLEAVVAEDPCGRARAARSLIDGIRDLAWLATALPTLPRRAAHHDAKADNVLVDGSGRVVAIVDLDTVMPGSPLWDAGDLVRSLAGTAAEHDADHMEADAGLARRVLDAFAAGSGDLLDDVERGALRVVGPVVAWEQSVRFLTDHLAGDVYFRTDGPGHNADRASAQLRLTRSLVSTLPP
jgi:Ser/Thr protein kinase RdoA (MazF antagonist)